MFGNRSNRGAMTSFLDAHALWIKANLHRQQREIAKELLDMVPPGQLRGKRCFQATALSG